MTETKAEGATLTLTHHTDAPIGRVFRAFTDAAEEENELGPDKGIYMHSMDLSIVDADNITQRWIMLKDGEAMPAHDMHLTRVQ